MLSFKLIVLLASLSPAISPPQIAAGELHASGDVIATDVADLQDQLEAELRARTSREFAFIANVVTLVEQDTLPLKLVRETFLWARKKQPYPFPYFQRALRIRAAKIGVQL